VLVVILRELVSYQFICSIQFMFLKWPKWMSSQGPPRDCITFKGEMRKMIVRIDNVLVVGERSTAMVPLQCLLADYSSQRESSSANCWKLKRWHHQAVSASRAKRLLISNSFGLLPTHIALPISVPKCLQLFTHLITILLSSQAL